MLRDSERTAIHVGAGPIRACLIFPERYEVGMSNLGFHQVYRLMASHAAVACERGFRDRALGAASFETGRRLGEFDLLGFALPFELNYIGMVAMLEQAGIPVRSSQRDESHPIVIAGGVAVSANPEPVAPFVDAVIAGDAEPGLETVIDTFAEHMNHSRSHLLDALASRPGVYVPSRHEPQYDAPPGELRGYRHLGAGRPAIARIAAHAQDRRVPARSAVLTPHTEFSGAFLVELTRGCPRRCRFCLASALAPSRFFPADRILAAVPEADGARKVGLVGASVSDHPALERIVTRLIDTGHSVTVSSLRHDTVSDTLLSALARGGQRTVTFAPETGSRALARRIGKEFRDGSLEDAAARAITAGLRNVKLYFMIGLPEETDEDVAALTDLVGRVAARIRILQREGYRVGGLRTTVGAFVPKPLTAFEDVPVVAPAVLRSRVRRIMVTLRRQPLVTVSTSSHRWFRVQAVLSRSDRRGADLIESIVLARSSPGAAVRRWVEAGPAPAIDGFDRSTSHPWDVLARADCAAAAGSRSVPRLNSEQCTQP